MAFNYDDLNPANDSFIADFPANERAHRDAVVSSLEVDHDPEGLGEHTKVSLQRIADDPTLSSDAGFLYAKLVDAKTELFWQNDAADVVQLTDEDSASPDKVAVGGDTMTGDLIMDSGNILLQGTSLLMLLNAKAIQARDQGDTTFRSILMVDGSDVTEVGNTSLAGGTRINAPSEDLAVVEYGGGDKKIWHEGHFATAPSFTNFYESENQAFDFTGTGAKFTLAHEIGAKPDLWLAVLVCIDAQEAYVVGDEIPVMFGLVAGAAGAITVAVNATNFEWYLSDTNPNILKSNGTSINIDDEHWELVFRAWY